MASKIGGVASQATWNDGHKFRQKLLRNMAKGEQWIIYSITTFGMFCQDHIFTHLVTLNII